MKNLLKYLIGLAVLAWVVHANWEPPQGQPGPGLKQALNGVIHFRPLLIAVPLVAFAVLLTFVRWYLLVRALDLPLTPRKTARLCLFGYFFNTLLPGAIGGDLVKAAALIRSEDRATAAIASIIFDRAIGLGGLAILVILSGGIYFWLGNPPANAAPTLWAVFRSASIAVGAAAIGWFILGFLPAWRAERLAHQFERLPIVGHKLAECWRSVWLYRKRPLAVTIAVVMTVLVHVFNVIAFDQCAAVFAPNPGQLPSLPDHLVLVPVGIAIKALFPAPGGVGGAEFSFGKMYELIGRPAALGVLASLAFLLVTWFLAACAYVAAQFVPQDLEPTVEQPKDI
jgi:glycosyltransferase 2 family protein